MSVEELADNFRGLALEQEYLLFNPPTEHRWLVRTFDEIPRYLFRIQTTRSNGLTDSNWAKSKDAKNRKPDSIMDIFSQPQNSVADMLSRHLWWETEDRPHNFLSWTSSLLFAIQYIFYRFHNDPLSLQDIQIYIVDTTEFPNGVFARDLDLIKIFSPRNENLQSLQKLRNRKPTGHSGLYFGEYLSQGALKIKDKCGFVSAQDFVGPQLFRLRPEFERALETDMGWAKEVVRLREIFYRSAETEGRIGDLQAAIHLGDLFGGCWALPIVISLMALRPCRDEDKVLIVRELLTTHGAREASRYCDTKRIGSHNERLPEVKLFDEIMLKTYVKSTFELLRESRECEIALMLAQLLLIEKLTRRRSKRLMIDLECELRELQSTIVLVRMGLLYWGQIERVDRETRINEDFERFYNNQDVFLILPVYFEP